MENVGVNRKAGLQIPKHDERSANHTKSSGSALLGGESEGGSQADTGSMTSSDDFEMDHITDSAATEDYEGATVTRKVRQQHQSNSATGLEEGDVPRKKLAHEEELLARKTVWSRISVNLLFIGLWYLFSISISVYNKWLFNDNDDQKKIVFPFPLFTTCVHMIVQFLLASLILYTFPRFRPRSDAGDADLRYTRDALLEDDAQKRPLMSRWFYFTRIGPCGTATGLDIGLGNMSLKYISLTFYTMCKSSVLGFVLLFAFMFRLEKPSWKLFGIITVMTVGVLMMVAGESAFNALGFALVMSAAASSGFRWSLTQILLLRNPATSNPFSSIFFLAPVMFVTLLILAIPIEGFSPLFAALRNLAAQHGLLFSAGMLLFPGCLAFAMTASEFALLQRTSVVTLSVCGIFKEVLTISTASIVFNDDLTPINISGLFVTIITMAYYNYVKIQKMKDEAQLEAHVAVEQSYAPVLAQDPDFDENEPPGAP